MTTQSSVVSKHEADGSVHNFNQQDPYAVDIEKTVIDDSNLMNSTVQNYAWKGITITVKDHKTKQPKAILQDVSGIVEAGKLSKNSPFHKLIMYRRGMRFDGTQRIW